MAIIATAYINLDKIPEDKIHQGKSGRGVRISVALNNEITEWDDEKREFVPSETGNNVAVTVGQSKEEIEAKDKKVFLGNGQVKWTDGDMPPIPKSNYEGKPYVRGGDQGQRESSKDSESGMDEDVPF
jgi:hypothetical protein